MALFCKPAEMNSFSMGLNRCARRAFARQASAVPSEYLAPPALPFVHPLVPFACAFCTFLDIPQVYLSGCFIII